MFFFFFFFFFFFKYPKINLLSDLSKGYRDTSVVVLNVRSIGINLRSESYMFTEFS